MREMFLHMKETRPLKSILLVFALVAVSMVVVFPLTAPEVKGQVTHLASAYAEDQAGSPYDMGPKDDGEVIWDQDEDHIINPPGYVIEANMTLNIPALNYKVIGDPEGHKITLQGIGSRIDVFGTLLTNGDGITKPTRTAFVKSDMSLAWEGIYFHVGSEGRIYDTLIKGAINGVVFEPGSTLISPGVAYSEFKDIVSYGMRMDGALGFTNMYSVQFDDSSSPSAVGLVVSNGSLDMSQVFFFSHGPGLPGLHISNANVNIDECQFNVNSQPGNMVLIEGSSDGTRLNRCLFFAGQAGDPYIEVNGSSPIISNCLFSNSNDELSVVANEKNGIPAHPVILNPTAEGTPGDWTDTFDNSSMNATGDSSVTLKWYMDVYVDNPNGDPKDHTPVWVKNRNGDPAEPPFKLTEDDDPEPLDNGWARGFVVTELIKYESSVENFNPFNVTAEDFPPKGYAVPEPTMNMSREVYITVPFDPDNVLPIVTWITTPVGIQSGLITIHYRLEDPNPGENGSLSVQVVFSTNGIKWYPATQAGGHPLTGLYNNTLYTFIWDSNTEADLSDQYNTTVYIKIVPYDEHGEGTANQTDNFTVDNKAPVLTLPPMVTEGDDWTLIEWTADEPANATVHYGLFVNGDLTDLTDQQSGSVLTKDQSVNLTSLMPGRKYTFVVESTDILGHSTSSSIYTFETEVHIALYEGWNMISVPPFVPDPDVGTVLTTIAGDWAAVHTYEPWDPTDPWKQNVSGKPFGNDLHWIYEYNGLWILMRKDATLIPDQLIPDPASPPYVVLLIEGWNFVGYPSAQTRTVADALSGISYSVVMTYDAATGEWLSNDGPGGETDTLNQMEMGRGYWIYSMSPMEQEWNVYYT